MPYDSLIGVSYMNKCWDGFTNYLHTSETQLRIRHEYILFAVDVGTSETPLGNHHHDFQVQTDYPIDMRVRVSDFIQPLRIQYCFDSIALDYQQACSDYRV